MYKRFVEIRPCVQHHNPPVFAGGWLEKRRRDERRATALGRTDSGSFDENLIAVGFEELEDAAVDGDAFVDPVAIKL
jgi:hypothetical protein